MSIIEKLNQQILDEYKSGNAQRRVVLQTIKAALQKKKIDLGEKFDAAAEIATLKSELKQRQEASEMFAKGGRNDLVEKTNEEIKVLKGFLPEELSDDQIKNTVSEVFNSTEDKTFGNLMKLSMAQLKGQADGSRVASAVNQLINK